MKIGAIDAGSNGIRAAIAVASSASAIRKVETERVAIRLGEKVFTDRKLAKGAIHRAVDAFKHFRDIFAQFRVQEFRAVATSALREAENRGDLISSVADATGIRLEVIDGAEEARLVREAVVGTLGAPFSPRLIFDLGGGSLELSLLDKEGKPEWEASLPIGTVRLMEQHGFRGAMSSAQVQTLRQTIDDQIARRVKGEMDLSGAVVAGCGGNAKALTRLVQGGRMGQFETIDIYRLYEMLWPISEMDVEARMKSCGVRRDRAEVMAIAAVVITSLARRLNVRRVVVPGVGVRDGLLREVAIRHFHGGAGNGKKERTP